MMISLDICDPEGYVRARSLYAHARLQGRVMPKKKNRMGTIFFEKVVDMRKAIPYMMCIETTQWCIGR